MGPLPSVTDLSPADLLAAMQRDKKVVAGRLHFVLPRGIGDTVIVDDVAEKEIRRALGTIGIRGRALAHDVPRGHSDDVGIGISDQGRLDRPRSTRKGPNAGRTHDEAAARVPGRAGVGSARPRRTHASR